VAGVLGGRPRAQQLQRVGGARAGLDRVGVQPPLAVGQRQRLDVQHEVAHDRVLEALGAAAARVDVVLGPPGAELGTGHGELADQRLQRLVVRVATDRLAQDRDRRAAGHLPVGEQLAGPRVQEHPARVAGAWLEPGQERPSHPVHRVDVAADVDDHRRDLQAVQQQPQSFVGRRDPQLSGRGGGDRGAHQVVQVQPLDLRQPQRAGDRVEDLVGRLQRATLLQARVVVQAHAGEHRHLLATQPGDAALAGGLDADVLWLQPRPPRAQELAQLGVQGHVLTVEVEVSPVGGSVRPRFAPPLVRAAPAQQPGRR